MKSFSTTDFRVDLKTIKIATLIIHGDSDKTVPKDVNARKTAAMIPTSDYKIYAGELHGLFYTQKDFLNDHL